jgi:hypothetical protein
VPSYAKIARIRPLDKRFSLRPAAAVAQAPGTGRIRPRDCRVLARRRCFSAQRTEAARQFFLTAWNGDLPYVFDRVEAGTKQIRRAFLCLMGGFQPSILANYVKQSTAGSRGDDLRFHMEEIYGLVIPPLLSGCIGRTYAAIFSFWAGVMPPMPMFGRSLLYVHSHCVA